MEKVQSEATSNAEMVTISRAEYKKQQDYISELERQNQWLLERLKVIRQKKFGSSSEHISEEAMEQLSLLFDEAEAYVSAESAKEKDVPAVEVRSHKRKKSGSVTDILPEDIEVVAVEHGLSEEERICPQCGEVMEQIGTEVRDRLKLIPAKAVLYRDIYYTYACRHCEENDISTPVIKTPQEPVVIPGSYATAEAVAHIMTQKFVMGAPLYRQEQEWNRQGIVVHYLGVPNADNPYLYGGGYGGHYNIKRDGSVYKAADPKTAVVWHCGGELQGSGGHTFHGICTNFNSIGIECGVCYTENVKEASGDSGKWYFTTETQESLVWLVSKLMNEYGIGIDHVIRHYDVTGKICPNPYVKNNRLRTSWTWDDFKARLAEYRKDGGYTASDEPAANPIAWYRVRKSWEDAKSQKGAYKILENAKKCADENPGYSVFDSKGVKVYSPKSSDQAPTETAGLPFLVKVSIPDLNIRKGPGTEFARTGQFTGKGVFTIVEVSGNWGRLKSGAGWISLSFTTKL